MRLFFISTLLLTLFTGSVSGQCLSDDSNPYTSGMSFSNACVNEGGAITLSLTWGMDCPTFSCTAPAGSWGVKISFPASGEYGVTDISDVITPSLFNWSDDAGNKTLTGYSNANVSFGQSETVVVQVHGFTNNSCAVVSTSANIFLTSPLDMNIDAFSCLQAFQNDSNDDNTESSSGVDVTLPIQLTSFKSELKNCEVVDINWATASETNNQKFILERKFESKQDFVAIAEVEGAGTSNTEIRYNAQDELTMDFPDGVVYYRLKQVDFDGKSQYSNVISVNVNCQEAPQASVFPNPVVKELNVKLPSLWEGDAVTIEFYNEQGKLVRTEQVQKVTDLELQFNIGDLPTGIYNLKLTNNNSTLNKRFVRLD